MTVNPAKARHYLKSFKLEDLFLDELGWDRHAGELQIPADGQTYTLRAVAEKRGAQIFVCEPGLDGKVPDRANRMKIERQLTKSAYEHLVVFADADRSVQIWQWVARQPGQPTAYREHHHHPHSQSGDALIQKFSSIAFSLDEEHKLTLTGVTVRLRDAFDRDRVTKKFYDRFQKEHQAFLRFIKGVGDEADQAWYASLMLNGLMFVYFIQRKGFLDGDTDYLRNRLKKVQERKGKGKFLSFYRHFLRRLFHEGLSQQPAQRAADLEDLLGKVPYLNGGIFELHGLEQTYTEVDIPDEAFERIFAFFDEYEWHLDTRPLAKGNEINPDVLGYIFEKYINQKQMGAYYTKEDITEYISENTIIPFLFGAAQKKCAVAFESDSALWRLLRDDPDRYLYEPVRRGVIDGQGNEIPETALPDFVRAGMYDPKARMFDRRYNLREADLRDSEDRKLTLPTETWREYVNRRRRCLELRAKLAKGEVLHINDLITYNLDIRQFAEDVISNCDGPELLRAFWRAIVAITVLDPTCGSGAFLFAALNILEPLYEACLGRMEAFLEDLEHSGERHRPEKFSDFRKILDDVNRHPNRRYFILKTIVVNNLYGVDIMEEAAEICKLRLFLKLVAQVEAVRQLEPLPDIDFNIRAGNTLVGFVSIAEVRKSAQWQNAGKGKQQGILLPDETEQAIRQIEEKAREIERAFHMFHEMQTREGMDAREFAAAKTELRARLRALGEQLDRYLAREYGIDTKKTKDLEAWRRGHQPFHWFTEFYGIMHKGGFDVIVGNPPYLERSKLGGQYSVRGFRTDAARDIYAWVVERAVRLLGNAAGLGLIVPVSISSSGSFDALRDVVDGATTTLWLSHFASRPGQLFSGAQNRLTILLRRPAQGAERSFSTRYHRWDAGRGERDALLSLLEYTQTDALGRSFEGLRPKVGRPEAASVVQKLASRKRVRDWVIRDGRHPVYWVRVPGYFCQFFLRAPMATPEVGGTPKVRGEVNSAQFADPHVQAVLHSFLNSSIWFQFYSAYSDGRHVNPSDVLETPFDHDRLSTGTCDTLGRLSRELSQRMRDNTSLWRKSGLLIESVDSAATKPVLDEIDGVLAAHFALTDDELDYIVNYDVKYRMGSANDDSD